MKNLIRISLFLMLLSMAACSGCNSKQGEDNSTTSNTETETEGPVDLTTAINQAQEAISQAGKLQEGEPLNFRELQEFLPEKLGGLDRTSKSGQTNGTMGFKVSQAEGKYQTREGKNISIEVFDTGGLKMGLMAMAAWANMEMDREDDNGYERTTTLKGHKAFEKYNKRSNKSELSLLVNNRFIIKGEGRDVKMEDLKDAIKDMPLGKMN